MPTAEEALGNAVAEQIGQMQSESAAFNPVNDKLREAQEAMINSLLRGAEKRNGAPQVPEANAGDFAWIIQQMQAQPFIIPYLRVKVAKSLEAIAAAADKILKEELGTPTEGQ